DAEKCERFSDDIMLYFLIWIRMILGRSGLKSSGSSKSCGGNPPPHDSKARRNLSDSRHAL
ncbi:hypothetical protein ACCT19_05310, partial [Rhizobium ruizarguesonis]